MHCISSELLLVQLLEYMNFGLGFYGTRVLLKYCIKWHHLFFCTRIQILDSISYWYTV